MKTWVLASTSCVITFLLCLFVVHGVSAGQQESSAPCASVSGEGAASSGLESDLRDTAEKIRQMLNEMESQAELSDIAKEWRGIYDQLSKLRTDSDRMSDLIDAFSATKGVDSSKAYQILKERAEGLSQQAGGIIDVIRDLIDSIGLPAAADIEAFKSVLDGFDRDNHPVESGQ